MKPYGFDEEEGKNIEMRKRTYLPIISMCCSNVQAVSQKSSGPQDEPCKEEKEGTTAAATVVTAAKFYQIAFPSFPSIGATS